MKYYILKTIFFTVGIILSVQVSQEVLAQSSTPDQLSDVGSCPSEKALKALRGVRKVNKGMGYSLVIQSSAELFTGSAGGDVGISEKFFKLFERVTIYKADKQQKRLLVSNRDRSLCGWVHRDALLGLQTPGRMQTANKGLAKKCSGDKIFKRLTRGRAAISLGPRQLTEACAPPKWHKKRSPLKLRAVIHNLSVEGDAEISLYASPGSRKKVASWKKFEIFDVFAAKKIGKREAINGRKGHYVLVGAFTALGKTIHGWLHEDDIYIWTARMAAYWAGTGKADGVVNGLSILKEPEEMPSQKEQILPRLPVLDSSPSAKDLNCMIGNGDDEYCEDAEIEETVPNSQVLNHVNQFNVVVPGQHCKNDDPNDCISSAKYDELMTAYHSAIKRYKKVDVVFLIDGTASMQPYFGAVANAVSRLTQYYSTSNEATDLRVAAVLYGDYEDNAPRISSIGYRRVVSLHDPDQSLDIEKLSKQNADMSDPHEDLLEAPLGAIVKLAVEKRNDVWWRVDSGVRFIIHIADHGNRVKGEKDVYIDTPDGKRRFSFDIDESGRWQDVVKVLKSRDIFYAPIAVRGTWREEANQRFIEQAGNIAQALGQLSPPLALPLIRSMSENTRSTQRDIYEKLKDIISTQVKFRETLVLYRECASQGMDEEACQEMMKTKGSNGGAGARFLSDDIIRKALPEQAQNLIGRHQTVLQVGIEPRKEAKDMLTYWMMVHEKDWIKFREGYQIACNNFSEEKFRASSYKELKEALAEIAIGLTGGVGGSQGDGETVGSLLKKISYIFPGLIPPPENIKDDLGIYGNIAPEDREKWHKNLCKINAWFKRIDNNETIGDGNQAKPYDMNKLIWSEGKWRAAPGSVRKFDWRHTYGNGMVFYFIPVEFLKFPS